MRPRERLQAEGAQALSAVELIAILLRTGTPEQTAVEVAAQLLEQFGGLAELSRATLPELEKVKGVGSAKAIELQAAFELGRRLPGLPLKRGVRIRGAEDVFQYMHARLRELRRESLYLLLLDRKHRVREELKVSEGTLDTAMAEPREIFAEALRRNAAAAILVHNHPSGDPTPSRDDVVATRELCEWGERLGIYVLDHIIIGDGVYVSMRKEGSARFAG